MQTFLPLPSFEESLSVLDDRRLGKQRVEAFQIHRALTIPGSRWVSHPAVKMWRGYEIALLHYMNLAISTWSAWGFANTMRQVEIDPSAIIIPWWFGMDKFHASHRANLLRKDPEYYSQFGWKENPSNHYFWPRTEEREEN